MGAIDDNIALCAILDAILFPSMVVSENMDCIACFWTSHPGTFDIFLRTTGPGIGTTYIAGMLFLFVGLVAGSILISVLKMNPKM
ncbi:MAG: hypothetical protein IPK25_13335 [Saprospiraceae bacterium]|nr:hypothetical protein [Saprospiraceae bacterium]